MAFDPFTPAAIEDPYPQYARLRATDPVHWSDKLRSWVLCRYDDVAAAFRDDLRLSSERSPSGVPIRTVASDPPAHGPVRAMLTASLGPRVRTVGAYVQELVATLLDVLGPATTRAVERAELDGEVDLIAGFAYPLPIQVIAQLFDVPPPERTIFEEHSRAIARGMDRFFSSGEAMEGLRQIGAYFLQMVHLYPEPRAQIAPGAVLPVVQRGARTPTPKGRLVSAGAAELRIGRIPRPRVTQQPRRAAERAPDGDVE